MKLKFLFIFTIVFASLFSFSGRAEAASVFISPSSGSYTVGDVFSVGVFVSTTSDKAINALSGKIIYPTDKLTFVSASKVNSIVNVWTSEPAKDTDSSVHYEGIVLNPGYNGSKGRIATITFKAKTAGIATLSFSSASVLANDGLGTNVLDTTSVANISIAKAIPMLVATPVTNTPPPATPASVPVVTITPIPELVELQSPYKKFNFNVSNVSSPINSYTVIINDSAPITWIDDGTGVFTTPELLSGKHTLAVSAIDSSGTVVKNSIDFTISALDKPTIKAVNQNLYDGDFLVVSGHATPNNNVDIYVKTQTDSNDTFYNTLLGTASYVQNDFEKSGTVLTDKNGAFTFVYGTRTKHGKYSIYAVSVDDSGAESKHSDSISVSVDRTIGEKINAFVTNGLILLVLPLIGLITLLRIIIGFISRIYNLFKTKKREADDIQMQ